MALPSTTALDPATPSASASAPDPDNHHLDNTPVDMQDDDDDQHLEQDDDQQELYGESLFYSWGREASAPASSPSCSSSCSSSRTRHGRTQALIRPLRLLHRVVLVAQHRDRHPHLDQLVRPLPLLPA